MTIPQPVRAIALAKEHLPDCKDAAYIIGLLETKARRAQAKAPAKAKRVQVRRLLRRAGEVPKTKSDWMHEADKWFSRFIRLRDTTVYESESERWGQCVTCRKWSSLNTLQCGHWIRRENWATRFEENNCHAQCKVCNGQRGGMEQEHELYIITNHGQEVRDRLLSLKSRKSRKPGSFEFQFIAEKYEKKVLELGGWPIG